MAGQTHLPPNWQIRVIYGLNAVPNDETVRFLNAWQRAEGGRAKWNPLNSTLWVQSFTELPNYNDIPVRNYTYPNVGVAATVLTLSQHEKDGTLRFGKIVNEIQQAAQLGRSAEDMLERCKADIVKWGTDAELMARVLQEM